MTIIFLKIEFLLVWILNIHNPRSQIWGGIIQTTKLSELRISQVKSFHQKITNIILLRICFSNLHNPRSKINRSEIFSMRYNTSSFENPTSDTLFRQFDHFSRFVYEFKKRIFIACYRLPLTSNPCRNLPHFMDTNIS